MKRLEDEAKEGEDDLDGHLSLGDAAKFKIMIRGTVSKWMVDRGFGFVKYDGETIFCHSSRVVSQDCLKVGSLAWIKVMKDDSRDSLAWKAMEAWPEDVWVQEKLKRKAKQAVDLAERAAKVVVKSVENVEHGRSVVFRNVFPFNVGYSQ